MAYKDITPPVGGKITIADGKLTVPENPILPFIRGDGTGPRHLGDECARVRRGGAKGLRRQTKNFLV